MTTIHTIDDRLRCSIQFVESKFSTNWLIPTMGSIRELSIGLSDYFNKQLEGKIFTDCNEFIIFVPPSLYDNIMLVLCCCQGYHIVDRSYTISSSLQSTLSLMLSW